MVMRCCTVCGADISDRPVNAVYCERLQCYSADRKRLRRDAVTWTTAGALALRITARGMKSTVVHTTLHGWCVRTTLPHDVDVFFIDDDDLNFFLTETGAMDVAA